jgi:GT2 family glycosyltransferase
VQHTYPDVSLIILTYNGSKYVEALLDSLFDQSYPLKKMEIIVVDNASVDNTLSIVQKKYPQVRRIALEQNVGFAAGNNQGFQQARHNFLVFLNQDTICHRDWLRELMNTMIQNKQLAACNPNIMTIRSSDSHPTGKPLSLDSLFFCDLSPFGYGRYRQARGSRWVFTKLLSGCAFIIRRETILELGGLFDEQFWMYAEDTDLSLRIHNLGDRIGVVRDAVVYHLHDSGLSIRKNNLYLFARAIMNRVHAFFKNMGKLEFLLFFPFLFFGGIFKIFEIPLKTSEKFLYFIPFSIFSMVSMLMALPTLPKFAARQRCAMKERRTKGFPILKLVLKLK